MPEISTIDTTTFQLIGSAPAYRGIHAGSTGEFLETPEGVDATGLIFGAADYGVAFDDAAFHPNFSLSNPVYPISYGASPAEGSVEGTHSGIDSVTECVGGADDLVRSQSGDECLQWHLCVQGTAPPARSPGPVNIRIFESDGESAIMPQAFSYGPSPITYGTLAAGPQGGATADLFGNGFSADVQGAPINVRIDGQDAPVTKTEWADHEIPYAMYLQHLRFTTPPGTPGAQDITINSPTGSTNHTQRISFPEKPGRLSHGRQVTGYPL